MKKLIFHILVVLLLAVSISAQAEENKPKLIDEFGVIGLDETWNRISGLTVAIGNTPNSKALVRIHGGQKDYFGAPYIKGSLITAIWKNTFKMPNEKLSIQYCNINNEPILTRFFLVSGDDKVETCEENLIVPKETVRFNNIYFSFPKFKLTPIENLRVGPIDVAQGEYSKISWDILRKLLKDSSGSKVYVIAYLKTNFETDGADKAKNENPRRLDKKYFAARMLQNARSELIKNGFASSRIVTIDGGYANLLSQKLEFWFVPKGGAIPKPKPDYIPKKKRKKFKIQ